MPAIARSKKNTRTKEEWKIWKENACLNLLEWLKERQQERGIESEYQFEKAYGLPQNTFNRLRNVALPSPEKTQKIVEGMGIDWGKYGEILNQPREDCFGESRKTLAVVQQSEMTLQEDMVNTLEYLQLYMEKFKNQIKLAQNENFSRRDKEELSMFFVRAMIKVCIKELNLTDEDIKERIEFLCSIDDELFFSWDTFEAIRDGSRKLADKTEATAMSSIMDPERQVFQLNDWKRAQILDSMNGDLNNGDRGT
ncbi:MAG: hypothetical protein J7647_28225 [Cyanobacteria bacterium SBLK]|nr:hypothetical protein [Cyanobacteria bacterium SBLK]